MVLYLGSIFMPIVEVLDWVYDYVDKKNARRSASVELNNSRVPRSYTRS